MNSKFIVAILFGIHATSAAPTCLQQYCQNSCLVTLSERDAYTCITQTDVDGITDFLGGCDVVNNDYPTDIVEELIESMTSVADASCSVTAQSCPAGYIKESDGTTCVLATTCLQQYCQNSCLVTLSGDTYTCLTQTDVGGITASLGGCDVLNQNSVEEFEELIEQDASVAEASCSDTAQSCPAGYEKESDDGTTCVLATQSGTAQSDTAQSCPDGYVKEAGDGTTCILSCSGLEENWNQGCSCNPDTAECVELKNTHAQQCSGQC